MSGNTLLETFARLRQRIELGDWGEAERLMHLCSGMLSSVEWTKETLAEARRLQELCEQSAHSQVAPMHQAVRKTADGHRAASAYDRAVRNSHRR